MNKFEKMQGEGKSEVTSALDDLTKEIKIGILRWFTKGILLIVLIINLIQVLAFLVQQTNSVSPLMDWIVWLTCPVWCMFIVITISRAVDSFLRWIFRLIFRIKS